MRRFEGPLIVPNRGLSSTEVEYLVLKNISVALLVYLEVKAKIIMLKCLHDTAVRTIFVMLYFVSSAVLLRVHN